MTGGLGVGVGDERRCEPVVPARHRQLHGVRHLPGELAVVTERAEAVEPPRPQLRQRGRLPRRGARVLALDRLAIGALTGHLVGVGVRRHVIDPGRDEGLAGGCDEEPSTVPVHGGEVTGRLQARRLQRSRPSRRLRAHHGSECGERHAENDDEAKKVSPPTSSPHAAVWPRVTRCGVQIRHRRPLPPTTPTPSPASLLSVVTGGCQGRRTVVSPARSAAPPYDERSRRFAGSACRTRTSAPRTASSAPCGLPTHTSTRPRRARSWWHSSGACASSSAVSRAPPVRPWS